MPAASVTLAVLSAIALGAFWPTLKVNFEAPFVKRFAVPALLVAVADCFVLAAVLGWWTALAYPLLALAGAVAISPFTSGRHLGKVVLGGGIWLVGILAVLLAIAALGFHLL